MRFCIRLLVLLACCLWAHAAAPDQRPSVLFVTPQGTTGPAIDVDWLNQLHAAGFEVDYLDKFTELNWERLRQYDVAVIYGAPAPDDSRNHIYPPRGIRQPEYVALLNQYLDAGGGVMAMLYVHNADEGLRPLLDPWGVRLPFERYRESDTSKTESMPRMRGREKLAFIESVPESPVSTDVRQVWVPYMDAYNGSVIGPIAVSEPWQVVLRGSSTSSTEPVDLTNLVMPAPPEPLIRPGGVKQPDLMAIREYRHGRLFVCSMWPQFTIGQGTQWLYNRRCLSKGFGQRGSDMEKLLMNTLRWLAQPALASDQVGGYVTDPQRLIYSNDRPEAFKGYEERIWPDKRLDPATGVRERRIRRGLLGVQTTASGGQGTVADYAAMARELKLDFLIFMEDFSKLTEERFRQLEAECAASSGDDLLLLPGYTIDTNIGNHLFLYGPTVDWPRPETLTGPDRTVLNIQFQNDDGTYEPRPVVLDWILSANDKRNVGYYNFDDPRAMKMPDLKLYSVAALRFYRDGKLVEDVTDAFLTTAQGTIPPTPVSVNLVRSPAELKREVDLNHALIYAEAHTVPELYKRSLCWSHQYAGPNVSVSDGPIIRAWPQCNRVHVFASERFVAGRELTAADLWVTSDKGLKSITIYNGRQLWRRLLFNGEKEFKEVLQFSGLIQRDLVLIAEDVDGGKAVSFALRCWKTCTLAPVYCGDHVNDCGRGYLAHGVGQFRAQRVPEINGGYTWDGGPIGISPTAEFQFTMPTIVSDLGKEGDRPYNNLPIIEFSDDQALVCRSVLKEVYDPAIPAVNAWHTYGPIDPSRLMEATRRYTEWNEAPLRVAPVGWSAVPIRTGAATCRYQLDVTFKADQTVKQLTVLSSNWTHKDPLLLVLGDTDGSCEVVDLSLAKRHERVDVPAGAWFGVYSPLTSNASLYVNRGEPMVLRAPKLHNGSTRLWLYGDLQDKEVKAGETHHYDLFSVSDPVDQPWRGPERFLRVLRYLNQPEGLEITRGKRRVTPGILVIAAEDNAVSLAIPRPANPVGMSLPVQVSGLNPNWSAGLFQELGYTIGRYSDGTNRYATVGFDMDGLVYAALFPDLAEETRVTIGQPVVCDQPEVIIEVVNRTGEDGAYRWHVAVNNPTDKELTTTLHQNLPVPGLSLPDQTVTLAAGAYQVILR